MTTPIIGGKIGPKAQALLPGILEGLQVISDKPGGVFELSVLRKFRGKDILDKGYFDDVNLLAYEAAKRTLMPESRAVYVNLQEIHQDCLHRAHNKMIDGVQAMTGKDVTGYRHFLIDVDRSGIKDISATDQEKEVIKATLQAIKEHLLDSGWPDPAYEADSGNGGHISWAVDLPATRETQDLLARCYVALNQKFGTNVLSIDKSLSDPNQLVKLYGTWARKGDDTELRPHRAAKVLATYESECVPVELLQRLASVVQTNGTPGAIAATQKQIDNQKNWWRAKTPEAVEGWANGHELQLGERIKENTQDGEQFKWKVDCLTSDEHKDGACLILNKNGYLKYKCHHDSCIDKWISDVLAKFPSPYQARTKSQENAELRTMFSDTGISNSLDAILGEIDKIYAGEGDEKHKRMAIVDKLAAGIGTLPATNLALVEMSLEDHGWKKGEAKKFTEGCVKEAKKRSRKKPTRLIAESAVSDGAQPDTRKTPKIIANDRQLRDITSDALSAIVNENSLIPTEPIVYTRSNTLVRILRDENGLAATSLCTRGGLRHTLSMIADWVEEHENEETGEVKSIDVHPVDNVVSSLLEMGEWSKLPALEGIVNAPVFSMGGTLHTEPGYNPQTRLYYTGGVTVGDTTPTPENISRAKNLILHDLLVDFPFKDAASTAHAVAYLLLPFGRLLIDGPTPLHLVNSPTPGTGKGKLVNACAYPALGYNAPTMTEGENDAEWRKRITTALMGGKTHIVIDNVRSGLDSSDLASALTQPNWSDRVLGGNREINIAVKNIWAATGNNIPLSEELSRRCVMIQLDANAEKPWERTSFKHENLMTWAKEHRNELVTAALTLFRAWIDAGMPAFKGKAKGSYEVWANVIGGVLQTVEIPGFLENENELFVSSVSTNQLLADFVKAWADEYETESTSSFNLFKLASFSDSEGENQLGGWHNLLGDMLGAGNQRSRQTKLGGILSKHKDKVIAGWKIVFDKASNGQKFYKLVEPLVERSKGSTTILPPTNDGFTKSIVEPVEPFSIPSHTREEKNNISTSDIYIFSTTDIERSMKGSTGSTDNFAYTNGAGVSVNGYAKNGVEPLVERSTENEVRLNTLTAIPMILVDRLRALGYSVEQIYHMQPDDARTILDGGIAAEVGEWTL